MSAASGTAPEVSGKDGRRVSYHFRTLGLIAEIQPSSQKKIGPIARRKHGLSRHPTERLPSVWRHHHGSSDLGNGIGAPINTPLLEDVNGTEDVGIDGPAADKPGQDEERDEDEGLENIEERSSRASSSSSSSSSSGDNRADSYTLQRISTVKHNGQTMTARERRIGMTHQDQFPMKMKSTLLQSAVNDLDETGLASLHIATQNNRVDVIEYLILQGADLNVKASVNGATPLHVAARFNCVDAAKVLLRYNADITAILTNGQSAIHIGCRRGHIGIVKILLNKDKTCVNAKDIDMTTPLHQAAICGDVDIMSLLVEKGAEIRAKDINDVTPLIQAAQNGFRKGVTYLLSIASNHGIFLKEYMSDVDNEGNTALHLAVANRHIHTAEELINNGASTECHKANGFTPLHQAAVFGEVSMFEMLIEKGAEVEVYDNEQMTPLHRAALYNHVDVITLLLRQGLSIDSRDEDNFTPLLAAAWKGQSDAGRSMLRYGADMKALDKEMKSCLHWAVELQHVDFVEMLFEEGHGGDKIKDWQDRDEQTSLHYASEVGNVKLVQFLIEQGVQVDIRDYEEKTSLHIASQYGHLDCVKALLEACPIPLNDDDIDDMTPLLLASQNGHYQVVKYLIKMGADMSKRNDDRRSALALAAVENQIHVMKILMENNADVDAMDKDKNTPLHLCARIGHPAPVALLIDGGADLTVQNIQGQYPLDVAIERKHEDVATAILTSKSWRIAMDNRDDTDETPMKRLIESVPGSALQVMNQCVSHSHDDKYNPDLQITYDYRYIDPGPDDPSSAPPNERYFALQTMIEHRREKLLAHELSQCYLAKKWSSFAIYVNFFDVSFYSAFLIVLFLYLNTVKQYITCASVDASGCPTNCSENGIIQTPNRNEYSLNTLTTDEMSTEIPQDRLTDPSLFSLQVYLIFVIAYKVFEDINNLMIQKIGYFLSPENWVHWCLFASVIGFVWPVNYPPCYMNWAFGAIAMFVAWINFIFIVVRFDFFGLYMTMFFTTLKSLLKAMVVYSFFFVGFTLSLYVCFVKTNPSFRNVWQSFLTTFVMTLGEIDKAELFDSGQDLFPFDLVSNFIFIAFIFIMPMVLINLTIGISVGDIDLILQSAYIQRNAQQVRIIAWTEKSFPLSIQRRMWFSSYTYQPNKQKPTLMQKVNKFLFSRNAKKSKFLRHTAKQENISVVTVEDVMAQVMKHEQTLSSLSQMAQQQGDLLRRIAEKVDVKPSNITN